MLVRDCLLKLISNKKKKTICKTIETISNTKKVYICYDVLICLKISTVISFSSAQ